MGHIENQSILDYMKIVDKNKKNVFTKQHMTNMTKKISVSFVNLVNSFFGTNPINYLINNENQLVNSSVIASVLSHIYSNSGDTMGMYNHGIISIKKMKDMLFNQINMSKINLFSMSNMFILRQIDHLNDNNILINEFIRHLMKNASKKTMNHMFDPCLFHGFLKEKNIHDNHSISTFNKLLDRVQNSIVKNRNEHDSDSVVMNMIDICIDHLEKIYGSINNLIEDHRVMNWNLKENLGDKNSNKDFDTLFGDYQELSDILMFSENLNDFYFNLISKTINKNKETNDQKNFSQKNKPKNYTNQKSEPKRLIPKTLIDQPPNNQPSSNQPPSNHPPSNQPSSNQSPNNQSPNNQPPGNQPPPPPTAPPLPPTTTKESKEKSKTSLKSNQTKNNNGAPQNDQQEKSLLSQIQQKIENLNKKTKGREATTFPKKFEEMNFSMPESDSEGLEMLQNAIVSGQINDQNKTMFEFLVHNPQDRLSFEEQDFLFGKNNKSFSKNYQDINKKLNEYVKSNNKIIDQFVPLDKVQQYLYDDKHIGVKKYDYKLYDRKNMNPVCKSIKELNGTTGENIFYFKTLEKASEFRDYFLSNCFKDGVTKEQKKEQLRNASKYNMITVDVLDTRKRHTNKMGKANQSEYDKEVIQRKIAGQSITERQKMTPGHQLRMCMIYGGNHCEVNDYDYKQNTFIQNNPLPEVDPIDRIPDEIEEEKEEVDDGEW